MSKHKPTAGRRGSRLPAGNTRKDITGPRSRGRISRISHGMGHGYIRVNGDRLVFFHRSDTEEGLFNKLLVDDEVRFELIEDRLSGARAMRVRKTAPRKARGGGESS
jgi:cold shock CspA family protein